MMGISRKVGPGIRRQTDRILNQRDPSVQICYLQSAIHRNNEMTGVSVR